MTPEAEALCVAPHWEHRTKPLLRSNEQTPPHAQEYWKIVRAFTAGVPVWWLCGTVSLFGGFQWEQQGCLVSGT